MVQIPEYNERIIANPEPRSAMNINQPSEFSDVSYLERINKGFSDTSREQAQIMFDMKRERDEGIATEFLNQYSMAKTEKLNELKEKYKGANSEGIIDEFKRWQEEYYTSHVGFSNTNNDGTLYLENKEQMKFARDALLKSAPSDINSLSLYAASELEEYKKNQFTARVQMEALDIAGETDLENIENKIAILGQTIESHYAGQSPEFIEYTKRKTINEAMTASIGNVIGAIDSIDSADLAMEWLNRAEKLISPSLYNASKNSINDKYAKLIGKAKAKTKSSGTGSLSKKAKNAGEDAAYVENDAEAAMLLGKEEELKSSMSEPEKRKFDAAANKAQLEEKNKIATEQKQSIAQICDLFKQSIEGGITSDVKVMYERLPQDYKDYLAKWGNSFSTEAEIKEYNEKQFEEMTKTARANAKTRESAAVNQEYIGITQDRANQAIYEQTMSENIEGADIVSQYFTGQAPEGVYKEKSLWSVMHDSQMEMNPLYAAAYSAGSWGARGVAKVLGFFDKEEVVTKTKEFIEDEKIFYALKSGEAKSPEEYLEMCNKIKSPELKNKALLMDALESKKRTILENSNINSTIESIYRGMIRYPKKGEDDALMEEFKDYVATKIATEVKDAGEGIGVNELKSYVRNMATSFATEISEQNTPASSVWGVYMGVPARAKEGKSFVDTKKEYLVKAALKVAEQYKLDEHQTILFTNLLLSNNIRAAKVILEVRRENGI